MAALSLAGTALHRCVQHKLKLGLWLWPCKHTCCVTVMREPSSKVAQGEVLGCRAVNAAARLSVLVVGGSSSCAVSCTIQTTDSFHGCHARCSGKLQHALSSCLT